MAKKKIEKEEQSAVNIAQQDEFNVSTITPKNASDYEAPKTHAEINADRNKAIKEQRGYITEAKKLDDATALGTARQNIKTIKSNAKEEHQAYNTKVKNDRTARQHGYADEAVGLVADWMERTGRDNIDEQSLATVLSPKQLWYFQKFNNKGSNWGNTLGGREFFGELNNNTVSSINQKAKERLDAKQQQDKDARISDEPLKTSTGAEMKIGDVYISNKRLNEMKDWGDGITDVNAISPEKVQQLYEKLESYGVAVPKEPVLDEQGNAVVDENNSPVMQYAIGNDSYTIDTILDELDDDGDMVLEALGFSDSQTNRLAVPHHRTYEEILADRQRAQDELRYANEQKALQRQQARLGLADLAAGIGDMIKASGGAIVTPRDYRAMYDSLTEQQKTNYNNYLARMDALKAEQKAKQKEAADRAYQEKLLATQHERDMEKLLQAQGFQAGESQKDRDLKRELLEKELKVKEAIAKLGEDAELANKLTAAQLEAMKSNVNIPVGDKTYTFGNKEASNAAINAMHGRLWNVLIDENGNYKPPYSTIIKNLEGNGVEKTEQLRAVVNAALNSAAVLNNPTLLKEIQMYMTQASKGIDAPADTHSEQSNGGMY